MQQSLSATDVREMQQADAAVTALTGGSDDCTQMTEDERTDAALQQLEALTRAGPCEAGLCVHRCRKRHGQLYLQLRRAGRHLCSPTRRRRTPPPCRSWTRDQLQELAENKRVGTAAIYYAFDNTINSARYPYYAYMQTYWDSVGLQTGSGYHRYRIRPAQDGPITTCAS